MAAHRSLWRVWQRYMDPDRFVFLDETGAATNMTRRYGWGPRGGRVVDDTPHGHWRTVTDEKLRRTRELVAKGLTVREAATRLKVGKTALHQAPRGAQA